MIQFTTPTYRFNIDVPNKVISDIEVTFSQDCTGATIKKEMKRDNLVIIDDKLNVTLSQEETGQFAVGSCFVQVRVLTSDGKVTATDIGRVKVEPSLSNNILGA